MNFGKALEALKAGYQVKLPSWAGYWQKDGDTVVMHCKDGSVLDIRETKDVFYTFHLIREELPLLWDFLLIPLLATNFVGGDNSPY